MRGIGRWRFGERERRAKRGGQAREAVARSDVGRKGATEVTSGSWGRGDRVWWESRRGFGESREEPVRGARVWSREQGCIE